MASAAALTLTLTTSRNHEIITGAAIRSQNFIISFLLHISQLLVYCTVPPQRNKQQPTHRHISVTTYSSYQLLFYSTTSSAATTNDSALFTTAPT